MGRRYSAIYVKMKRLFRYQYSSAVLSFLGVLAAYWLYAGIIIPAVLPQNTQVRIDEPQYVEDLEWKQYLANLFPEGNWERTSKYSIWKDNFVLLFDDYKEVDKHVKLNPCTVLFLTGEQGKDDEKLFRESIILQSVGGATLEFDGPFNLLTGSKSKFVMGRLEGDVSIRSNMQEPGPEDDLTISTKDVIFTDSQIQTDSEINFQFGMSHGKGRSLIVFLAPSDPRNSKSAKTISGVEFELQRDHKIHLAMPSDRQTPAGEPQYDRFEVTCSDKIEFGPDQESNFHWIGKFNKDVNIARVIEGSYDHLECNQLRVLFAPKPKPGEKPAPNNELASLQQLAPLEAVAVGNAKVRSPNNNDFLAEGDKLGYDFEKGRLVLDGDLSLGKTVKISLFGGKQWAVGKKIAYTFGQNGQFGELFAPNGGKLQGMMSPDKPQVQQRTFQLEWTDDLQAFPEPDNSELVRCQLFGQMSMSIENIGTMQARETVIWFKQQLGETPKPVDSPQTSTKNPLIRQVSNTTPVPSGGTSPPPTLPTLPTLTSSSPASSPVGSPAKKATSSNAMPGNFQSLTPDHARIRKDVRFITTNGVCNVNEMNVWFFEDGMDNPPGPPYADSRPADTVLTTSNATAAPPRSSSSRSFSGGNAEGAQFDLRGDTMELRVKIQGNAMEIDRLFLNGGGKQVRLEEKNPKQPADPIRMTGTEIRAWNPSSDHSVVQLLGTASSYAKIEGMESTLTALDIVLNQQANQIKIKGGGEITSTQLALSSDMTSSLTGAGTAQGTPSVPPQKKLLVVRWKGGMNFDGTRISFEKDVVAQYPLQELYCNVLNIDLDQPISLIQPKAAQNSKVRRVECLGKVFFVCEERDQTDPAKKKSLLKGENLDRIQIYPETGRFDGTAQGTGQGRLRATFLDEGNSLAGTPRTGTARAETSRTATAAPTNLTRADLYFYGKITGNFKAFDATATDSVVCVYCPVAAWDADVDMDDREHLKEKDGYRLDCDVLEIAKMVDPATQQQGIELTASGATKVEGAQIFARAESIKFNQLKETVIVEGNGAISAEVHLKQAPDGEYEEPIFVQQLIYNINTRNVESKGIRVMQFFK